MPDITQKEFHVIRRQLDYEKVMVNKYKNCYKYCSDPQLRLQCEQIAAKHEDNFIRLMNMLS